MGKLPRPVELSADALADRLRMRTGTAVWHRDGAEVLVHGERLRVALRRGEMLLGLTLETVETGQAELTVPFAVGTPGALAGPIAITERVPHGNPTMVAAWGEAVVATAWRSLVAVVTDLAAEAGRDSAGRPLVPAAFIASDGLFTVVPRPDVA
jgi:hypothetical protein